MMLWWTMLSLPTLSMTGLLRVGDAAFAEEIHG
jgi:hypothetical protein